ncbi:MAG: hypothetical protein AB7G37_03335 [Solirubrobacteraceae bacterium]
MADATHKAVFDYLRTGRGPCETADLNRWLTKAKTTLAFLDAGGPEYWLVRRDLVWKIGDVESYIAARRSMAR